MRGADRGNPLFSPYNLILQKTLLLSKRKRPSFFFSLACDTQQTHCTRFFSLSRSLSLVYVCLFANLVLDLFVCLSLSSYL
eukprot:SAG11_NODE_846_length_6884_cov_5.651732_3_plen_81_part_00